MVPSILIPQLASRNLFNQWFPPFCFFRLKKRISITHCSVILLPYIEERNMYTPWFLRFFKRQKNVNNQWFAPFCFLRLKEGKCTTHWFLGSISFDIRKEFANFIASSVWFPLIKGRDLGNTWSLLFWILELKKRKCICRGFLDFASLDWKKRNM